MKEIKLTQGKVTLVDDGDYEWLNQWKWYAHYSKGRWYAIRNDYNNGKQTSVKMHRVILNTPRNLIVDHWNGDGLNNQRYNIRNCKFGDNVYNTNSKNKYRGVFKRKHRHCITYMAYIGYNNKKICIGHFQTEDMAAIAYNNKAKELYGNFARLNIIE